jgi:hypothetical protein
MISWAHKIGPDGDISKADWDEHMEYVASKVKQGLVDAITIKDLYKETME